ncbi:MAG: hypothetical protein ACFBQW_07285 [Sphingomonadaceae bacterium]
MADEFDEIFDRIRAMFAAHERDLLVTDDAPGKYYLGTSEVRAKDGYRTQFGGVEIKKNYVSAHLMPVYAHPELLDGVSDGLKKRMQGKSCFNFKREDEGLFAELEALIARGAERFRADGRI